MATAETRLNVRLQGPLADHVNRQIESELYNSHSEYIRDLVRRDMIQSGDSELEASISRGLSDIEQGRYEPWDAEKSLKRSIAYAKSRRKK